MAVTCKAGNPSLSMSPGSPHHYPQTGTPKASSPKGKQHQSLGSISQQSQRWQQRGRGKGSRVGRG